MNDQSQNEPPLTLLDLEALNENVKDGVIVDAQTARRVARSIRGLVAGERETQVTAEGLRDVFETILKKFAHLLPLILSILDVLAANDVESDTAHA